MKTVLVFLSLLFVNVSFTQTTISGMVVEKGTGNPVPYATIGLMKKNVGINSNEKGKFEISVTGPLNSDTLIISSVGYLTTKIPILDPQKQFLIELEKKFVKLEEVVVKEKWRSVTLNDWGNCGLHSLVSTGHQRQVAQQIDVPVKGSYLSTVKVCSGDFYLSRETGVFRLRLYDMDSVTRGPGNDLYNGVIEVRSNRRTEKVDLAFYNILIPGKQFFVAVEWIYIPENERGDSSYDNKVYGPAVGILKDDGGEKVWSLMHNARWRKLSRGERMAISATVKY